MLIYLPLELCGYQIREYLTDQDIISYWMIYMIKIAMESTHPAQAV